MDTHTIEFKPGKDNLTGRGEAVVSKLATILMRHSTVRIQIEGHMDSDGDAVFNQRLSQDRVFRVKQALATHGVSSIRMRMKGYGESKPLVPNSTKANKQKNRRIEIKILY